MAFKTVLLIGATGHLGSAILPALQAAGFQVTVLTRASSKGKLPADVKSVSIADDFPQAELERAFAGQDVVVNAGSGAAVTDQKRIIDAAVAAGVRRYLPSEFGSDTSDPKVAALAPVWVEKEHVTDYLKTKEGAGAGKLTWTAVATGPFLDLVLAMGFAHFDFKNHKALLLDDGRHAFPASSLAQVGRGVAKVLQYEGDETVNKYVLINGFDTSQAEILAEFEKQTGAKWEIERRSKQDFLDEHKGAVGMAQQGVH